MIMIYYYPFSYKNHTGGYLKEILQYQLTNGIIGIIINSFISETDEKEE